jgi:hypothetical protein
MQAANQYAKYGNNMQKNMQKKYAKKCAEYVQKYVNKYVKYVNYANKYPK